MELNEVQDSNQEGDGVTQPLMSQEPSQQATTVSKRSSINLYCACIAANIATFSIGNCFTWTSPTLLRLMKPDNEVLVITIEDAAWIASLLAFGAIFGPFLASALVNRVGRKCSITISVVFICINWVILLFAHRVEVMYCARVVAGVGVGIIFTVVPMYVAEIAEDDVRDSLGSLLAFFLCTGFLVEYVVGPYVSYYILILVSLVSPIIFLVVFPAFMPETPYYLLQKGKDEEALKRLSWLRKGASTENIQKELNFMKMSVESTMQESGSFVHLFSKLGNRRGLLISTGLVAGQQLSGISVVLFYSESIFTMTGSNLSPSICSIIVAVILILASAIAPPLVKWFGMKWLLIASAFGMGVFQGLLGLYFYLHRLNTDLSDFNWLPIASLVGYITLYAVGFGPLPWAVMAEMFPPNMKAIGSAITTSFCWTIAFLMTKFFVDISSSLGEYISFWTFTVFCVFMVFFTLLELPETRRRSLVEIQDILNRRESAS